MVYNGPIEMDDLGVPLFSETSICNSNVEDLIFLSEKFQSRNTVKEH